ncbi:hypothetical protein AGMMS49975_15530 [Clostridia bacterium]|nr:hypothetical protein AGMMS49975_15530 [Clostridia bacterium]
MSGGTEDWDNGDITWCDKEYIGMPVFWEGMPFGEDMKRATEETRESDLDE